MAGNKVYVCPNTFTHPPDSSCHLCGAFEPVGNGKWGTVQCGGEDGVEGRTVEVQSDDNVVQMAEIEILAYGWLNSGIFSQLSLSLRNYASEAIVFFPTFSIYTVLGSS